MPRRMAYDPILFVTVGLLLSAGLLFVSSSSSFRALHLNKPADHFMIRQCIWTCIGLILMLVMMHVPYRRLSDGRIVATAIVAVMVALLAVLAMPAVSGANRWIMLGPLRVQPSEFAKLVAIVFAAKLLARKEDRVNDPEAVPLPLAVILGPITLLILIEPDLGSAVMLVAPIALMVFVAGLRWRYVLVAAGIGAIGLASAILTTQYRRERFFAFLEADRGGDIPHQLKQSLVALGHGGAFGVGLGNGHQKAYFLPEAHTDFVFAVIGEEFGLLGTLLVLAAFLVLFWRGLRAAIHAPDRFGFYLALGITTLLTLQALFNMGVCVGLFPTKGLTLPFLSYGGSSLLATLAATGVLLNVSQHSN